MNNRKSIFELERRMELKDVFDGIIDNFKETNISSKMFSVSSLLNCLFLSIKTWPYRNGATQVKKYAQYHGFCFNGKSDEDMFYTLELLLNLYYWFIRCESLRRIECYGRGNSYSPAIECQYCMENINSLLAQINYVIRERCIDGNFPQYIITKRDVAVDTVIDAVPELAEVLLSFLDFRNQNDVESKKQILNQIAKFLEPKRKEYRGTCYSAICDDLFFVFNNCNIRHNNDKKLALSSKQQMEICDKTFKASIHLLQKENAEEFQQFVEKLKKSDV